MYNIKRKTIRIPEDGDYTVCINDPAMENVDRESAYDYYHEVCKLYTSIYAGLSYSVDVKLLRKGKLLLGERFTPEDGYIGRLDYLAIDYIGE